MSNFIFSTDEEIEDYRLDRILFLDKEEKDYVNDLNAFIKDDEEPEEPELFDPSKHGPDTLGHYEVLHTAGNLRGTISSQLLQHPAILANATYYREARKVFEHLSNLYNILGTENEVHSLNIPELVRQHKREYEESLSQPHIRKDLPIGDGEVDYAKLDATTDDDIRRHMIEDGEDPDKPFRAFFHGNAKQIDDHLQYWNARTRAWEDQEPSPLTSDEIANFARGRE